MERWKVHHSLSYLGVFSHKSVRLLGSSLLSVLEIPVEVK